MGLELVFVELAGPDARNEYFPHAAGRMVAHWVPTPVPLVEWPNDAGAAGIWGPRDSP
jgi:hypothetical protein